jgi:hypothetical protein
MMGFTNEISIIQVIYEFITLSGLQVDRDSYSLSFFFRKYLNIFFFFINFFIFVPPMNIKIGLIKINLGNIL